MTENQIDCPVRERIESYCSCPKHECPNHGLCCECILAHKNRADQLLLKRLPHCLRDMVQTQMPEK